MSYHNFKDPQFGENVKDKIDWMGKIKMSTDTLRDDERGALKCKTMLYFIVDACVAILTGDIMIRNKVVWENCAIHFYAWLICVCCFTTLSFLINVLTYIQITRGAFNMMLIIFSTLIEVGMLILAMFVPFMASASNDCIDRHEIKVVVFVLATVMGIRVFQTVMIILFIVFCVPCYCFNDECFIKRRLISKKSIDPKVLKLLNKWSWIYKNSQDEKPKYSGSAEIVFDPADKCFICF